MIFLLLFLTAIPRPDPLEYWLRYRYRTVTEVESVSHFVPDEIYLGMGGEVEIDNDCHIAVIEREGKETRIFLVGKKRFHLSHTYGKEIKYRNV